MKRIVFRADASKENGTGDLLSLIYLAGYFKGWSKYFITKDVPAARSILNRYHFRNVKFINPDMRLDDEIGLINSFIHNNRIDAFFLEIAQERLCGYAKVRAPFRACVDFSGKIPDNFDLVINWELKSSNIYKQSEFADTLFLLGPQYTLLKKEMLECADALKKEKKEKVKIKNIILFFGGYDEFNFTLKAAKFLEAMSLPFNVRLILGAGYPFKKALVDFLRKAKFCSFCICENVVDMTEQYCWADLVVTSGGLSLFEAAVLRRPVIAVATYKHQIKRCDILSKDGIIKFLGFRKLDQGLFRENVMNYTFSPLKLKFRTLEIPGIVNDRLRQKSLSVNIADRRICQ